MAATARRAVTPETPAWWQTGFAIAEKLVTFLSIPVVVAWGSAFWKARGEKRKAEAEARERQAGDHRTIEQRRQDAVAADLARADAATQRHMQWLEGERDAARKAEAEAEARAECMAGKLHRTRRRLELAQQQINMMQFYGCPAGTPRTEFPPVED